MISGISLLGKAAEFIAHQVGAKELARSQDKRGQACQMITRLFYALVDLKSLTDRLHEAAKNSIEHNNPMILASCFRDCQKRIETSSNQFIETLSFLSEALEIFAPETAHALDAITHAKFNMLWDVSEAFVVEKSGNGTDIRKVHYLKPDDRLLVLDIEGYMQRLKTGQAKIKAGRFEWPDDFLYNGSIKSAFTEAEFSVVSIEDVKNFSVMLEKHGEVLDRGITALKALIKASFSLDEVLYEKKDISPEWFG